MLTESARSPTLARIPGSETPIFDKLAQEYVAKDAFDRFFNFEDPKEESDD